MIYDGDCSLCRRWMIRWQRWTGSLVEYAPFQELADRFREIPPEQFQKSVQLVLPDGQVLSGAHAVFHALACVPGKGWPLWMYKRLPGFAPFSEWVYGLIAGHRSFF